MCVVHTHARTHSMVTIYRGISFSIIFYCLLFLLKEKIRGQEQRMVLSSALKLLQPTIPLRQTHTSAFEGEREGEE